jgi:hypothetical protein
MKLQLKFIVIIAVFALAAVAAVVVFYSRPPVIIVTDLSFIPLYGEDRIRCESRRSSIFLFRKVETAGIADDASDDIVTIAISGFSPRPFCVIFPLRFANSARLYREQNPQVPVVLLGGRQSEDQLLSVLGSKAGDFFVYRTDIDSDFYRAGIAAASLDVNGDGKIAVFLETSLRTQAREAFLRGVNTLEKPPEALFFTRVSQFNESSGISCAVLAGTGAEYFEKEAGVPVIFFTWADPVFLHEDVALLVDDSPWAQCVQAVRMAAKQTENALIKSKFQPVNKKIINRETLRKIQK